MDKNEIHPIKIVVKMASVIDLSNSHKWCPSLARNYRNYRIRCVLDVERFVGLNIDCGETRITMPMRNACLTYAPTSSASCDAAAALRTLLPSSVSMCSNSRSAKHSQL